MRAFIACGRGLAAAHAAGLVHRDFKPENVLVGKDGRPRVTDFGLVTTGRAVGAAVELTDDGDVLVDGAVVGTPPYMAPEQWLGATVDARTDQYAFCVTLWEALTGQRPFTGTSTVALRDQVLTGQPRALTGAIPRRLKPVLRRGLARERAQSFLSDAHRRRIADAYHAFADVPGLADFAQAVWQRFDLPAEGTATVVFEVTPPRVGRYLYEIAVPAAYAPEPLVLAAFAEAARQIEQAVDAVALDQAFDHRAGGYPVEVTDHATEFDAGVIEHLVQPVDLGAVHLGCLLYTSPSPRDRTRSRMPSSA